MKHMNTTKDPARDGILGARDAVRNETGFAHLTQTGEVCAKRRLRRGVTLIELLIAIVIVGVLSGAVVFTVNRSRDAALDAVKMDNANKLNTLAITCFQSGFDTSTWATSGAAIGALRAGVTLPTFVPGSTAEQVVRIERDVNAQAYDFVPGSAVAAPRFTARLNEPGVRP
jgi:prepilin-type N-terminal cleavage/methylation domain-containing protein